MVPHGDMAFFVHTLCTSHPAYVGLGHSGEILISAMTPLFTYMGRRKSLQKNTRRLNERASP